MEKEEWDGKVSIEHQLDIHIRDLLQCERFGDEVGEILTGLQYVVDYRLREHQQQNLDSVISDRLVRALLLFTGIHVKSGLFGMEKRLSDIAEMSFALLADFCAKVAECNRALLAIPTEESSIRLRLGSRILKPSNPAIFSAAISLLHTLTARGDWREFFNDADYDEVHVRLERANFFNTEDVQSKRSFTTVTIYPPPALYFDRDPNRVLDMFQTRLEGLDSSTEVSTLRNYHGMNELPIASARPVWKVFVSQFADFMILILIVTTIGSAIVDYPHVESTIILGLVVLLNVLVGFWQELKSSRTIAAMRSLQIPLARVRRDGKEVEVLSTDLVPGDIVILSEGDFVPADLRIIRTSRLEINEVILTGEPIGVSKSNKPIRVPSRKLQLNRCRGNAFMGTMVTRGTGLGVVVRTGVDTEIGKIGAALNNQPVDAKPSPLQRQMTKLGKVLVILAVFLCVVVFVIGMMWRGQDFKAMIRLSVSLAVSVIPEGLVAIMTVGMALAVRRLSKRNVLIRRLDAVDTLGCTSVIAADKTGTLTEGRMRMEDLWTLPTSDLKEARGGMMTEERQWALKVCIICNNATINGVGEPTEVALMEGAVGRGLDAVGILSVWQRRLEIPFDSERRMMTVLAVPDSPDESPETSTVAFVKGAAEAVLSRCTTVMVDGRYARLDGRTNELIGQMENEYSDKGLRVLALAIRMEIDWSKAPISEIAEELSSPTTAATSREVDNGTSTDWIERDLTFIGLVCLLDPPREGVADAITTLHKAGIKFCMITGDHIRTAMAVAGQIGIYRKGDQMLGRAMKGTDLDLLSVDALASLQPFPSVFARVSPSNKLAIVQALQLREEKVAMTGDGVNDAPAVRCADVGVAMGRGGTQITREAASLVLLDDNLANMVSAVAEGRQMYRNVTLFLIYLLSCNSAEIWTVLGAMILGLEPPLHPMALLWANVIADIPPSMCLGLERDAEGGDLMTERPDRVEKTTMGWATWILIIVNGAVLSGVTLLAYGLSHADGWGQRRSEAFLILIGLQLLLALLSRSPRQSLFHKGIFGNRWLVAAVIFSFGLLLAGLNVPLLHQMLELEPVGWLVWAKFGIAAICMVIFNELAKFMIRHFGL